MWWYLLIINLTGFLLSAWDKRQARRGGWRVRERTLFAAALLGGTPGVYLSMLLFRHKTRHLRFMLGLPLILLIQLGLWWLLQHSGWLL